MISTKARRSTPKVRTGCATCKTHRIKCDERRPRCGQCTSAGRSCPGYPQASTSQPEIKMYNIPFKVPGSRADRELLHYYCCEAAGSLSRLSDTTLWTHLILQRCEDQSVIRNSIVALTSLYRDYMLVRSPRFEISVKHIQRITRSHSQLRAHLTRDPSAEVALICSLIFYTFECLIGNVQQALWHLDQGLILLRRLQTDYPYLVDGQETYAQLVAIFSQLDIHASIFLLERTPILRLASPEQVLGEMHTVPERISGLSDLETSLAVLQNWTLWHLMEFVEYKNLPQSHVPSIVIRQRLQLEAQLQKLEELSEKMATSEDFQSFTSAQRQRLILLRSQALIFHAVLLENIICTFDAAKIPLEATCRFDIALTQISTLLSLSSESESESSFEKKTPSNRAFTLSTNIIAMLYFICLKTSDRRILRTALSLMQGSLFTSRDGLWDARTAVTIVKAIVSEDDLQSEEPEMDFKLEDVGSGIVDTDGGLEEAFKLLKLEQSQIK
ncbi:Fungal transcriptional regulatory protein, N-terminal [Penicillium camemberti]|uniref:Fungal transcriptional regulatory protein, N-terminal n=1 Tax=Penicillium camemberti (strain FM 013) TaxID=1429867 RepID=A0A0G4PJZ2_PENC3|nr:Fungal transcriptional regulatory protein, N-terminal [Penicillium camemberti]